MKFTEVRRMTKTADGWRELNTGYRDYTRFLQLAADQLTMVFYFIPRTNELDKIILFDGQTNTEYSVFADQFDGVPAPDEAWEWAEARSYQRKRHDLMTHNIRL